jgi:hypothetical protein
MSRRIVSRHLLRRTARESEARIERLKRWATVPPVDPQAVQELRDLGVRPDDKVFVRPAGRIRARWVVVAER